MTYTRGNETVLVTGSSSGFGYETALLMAQRGYRVFATMRRPEAGERLVDATRNSLGEVIVRALDVTDRDQVEAVMAEAAEAGDLEAVVNNAGIAIAGFLEDMSEAEIREVFETNFFGLVSVTRAAVPYLRRRGRGTIVQVSSIGGRTTISTLSAYTGSKCAVEGFSKVVRHELRPLGIRVVLIDPFNLRTEIISNKRFAERITSRDSPNVAVVEKLNREGDRISERFGGHPVKVARKILQVIESPRPRAQYLIGPGALLFVFLNRLPFGIWERINGLMLKAAGYPPPQAETGAAKPDTGTKGPGHGAKKPGVRTRKPKARITKPEGGTKEFKGGTSKPEDGAKETSLGTEKPGSEAKEPV